MSLPVGFGLVPDAGTRWLEDGLLAGGSPQRLLRLGSPATAAIRSWLAGGTVGPQRSQGVLARRLVSAGMFHPRSTARPGAADVTVVVPVRNRPGQLATLLGSLRSLRSVVVDDGSDRPEETEAVARSFESRFVTLSPSRGPGAARNAGLAVTTTPFVAFVDSDCIPDEGWLEPLLSHFADPLVGAVAPRVPPVPGSEGWLARYEACRSPLDRGTREGLVKARSPIPFVPSAALVVRRQAVGDCPFDEALIGGEDVDLVWRLDRAGWDVRYVPTSTVWHASERTALTAWLGRRAFYGSTAGPLARRHGKELAPVSLPVWLAGAWALALRRRPAAAGLVVGVTALSMARRLRGVAARPTLTAARVVADGIVRSSVPVMEGATRAWGPLLVAGLASRRWRRVAGAILVLPPLAHWWSSRPRLDLIRYSAAHLADDLAYSAGLWLGCWRARTLQPLVPDLVVRPVTRRAWSMGAPPGRSATPADAVGAPGATAPAGGPGPCVPVVGPGVPG